jgi:peptidoglycan/LPS O-acetylase OafA/YrhL
VRGTGTALSAGAESDTRATSIAGFVKGLHASKIATKGLSVASKSAKQKRLLELDMLRALAIIMIVIGHTAYYVTTPLLHDVIGGPYPYLSIFGLSLFFFVSGFVLCYTHDGIETTAELLAFWKKRIIRIYPLYWLALISFFALGTEIDLSSSGMLIQLSGLQSLLAPRFINPDSVIWFVGVILIFYLIYPLIVYLSRDSAHLILAACAVLLPFVVLRLAFDIIDFRFFMYYGIFVAGILASKYEVMYKFRPQPRFFCVGFVLLIGLCFLIRYVGILRQAALAAAHGYLFNGYGLFSYNPSELPLLLSSIILLNIVALLFIYVAFSAARLYSPSISRALLSFLLLIAFASYSIYLFHLQIFDCVRVLIDSLHLGMVQADAALILLAYPLILAFAYFVTRGESNIVSRIRNIKKRSA